MKRFFKDDDWEVNDDVVVIKGDEHNHLAFVLRLKIGDEIICCYNDGLDRIGKILDIDKKKTTIKIESVVKSNNEINGSLTVFVGLVKGDKMEFLIQKLTELGVNKIIPFESEFSTVKISDRDKLSRYYKIARDASKQCGRSKLIEINEPIKFNQIENYLSNFDETLVAYEKQEAKFGINKLIGKNVGIIIGSEGGFSQNEIDFLKSKNVQSISLGKRILRAETASVVACSILLYLMGELGNNE
jgi:16S rRNA (uracil1498-N3)-methyltransferase